MSDHRIVCQFSCGAASAVATKLTLAQFGQIRDVRIINAFIKEENPDNRRFLADCETWFGRTVTVLRDEKYGASTDDVWTRTNYFNGPHGASCTGRLKKIVLDAWCVPGDEIVLGLTVEEKDRFDDWCDRNADVVAHAPLIERGLSHDGCLGIVDRAGILLPLSYRDGFHNANCEGCCKGGEGYWNHVRKMRPERFAAVMTIQEKIGAGAYTFRNRKTGKRYGLKDLPPDADRYQDEPAVECGLFCQIASDDIERGHS